MALDFVSILQLQFALKGHGFDPGKPDGRIGPATRSALNGFAEKYGTSADADSVFEFMLREAAKARVEITDEEKLKNIEESVAEQLRDPSSVMIRNVYRTTAGSDSIICGEVNGKNAYGGYAGFTPFFGHSVLGDFIPMTIDDSESSFAWYKCALGFPRKY